MTIFMTILLILGVMYAAFGFIMNADAASRKKPLPVASPFKIGGSLVVVAAAVLILWSTNIQIKGQEVGVVVTPNGVKEAPIKVGWNFVAPWNHVFIMDKTTWVFTFASDEKKKNGTVWVPTKDGNKMGIDLSVSWKIQEDAAPWIYQNVSENDDQENGRYLWIEDNIIKTKTKSALALIISGYSPEEVYSTKRQEIQDKLKKKIEEDLKAYRLNLGEVDIREVFYPQQFADSIEATKVATQDALKLKEITKQKNEQLEQAKIIKDIAIEQARGEAEALKIKGAAINQNPKIIELEWIAKWNGAVPQYSLGSGQGLILNLSK